VRVLILNWKDLSHPEVGGAEVIVYELARRLVRDGDDVTWFCRSFRNASPEDEVDGIRVVRRGRLLTTYAHAPLFYRRLRPRPDVVIDMVNTLCWQTPLYARERTVGYVNQLAQDVLLYHLPRPIGRIAYALERFQFVPYRRTEFLCYSQSTKRDLTEFGIAERRIRVFPLGLDHARYVPGRKSKSPLFVFVGRLAPMKRAGACIKALALVRSRRPDATMAIVGTGPDEDRLRDHAQRLGIGSAVAFVTRDATHFETTPGDRKVELMQRAWGLVLPSVKEGWGMVVTEAAACGTPAIVSDVTGLRDSTRHGETGLILSSHPSPQELGDAMLRLIEDESLRKHLERGAVEWAAQFDWEGSYQVFREHLLELAGR
jgi:glycosyltransferase involved in cell wall biosynthesis